MALIGEATVRSDLDQICLALHEHRLGALDAVTKDPAMRGVARRSLEGAHEVADGQSTTGANSFSERSSSARDVIASVTLLTCQAASVPALSARHQYIFCPDV
jgi:hypothetical protein